MKWYIMVLLLGLSIYSLAQTKPVRVRTLNVKVSIPFYQIQSMYCYQNDEARLIRNQTDPQMGLFTLSTGDKFSIFTGKISNEFPEPYELLDHFIFHLQEDLPPRNGYGTHFLIYLEDKTWTARAPEIAKAFDEELAQEFPQHKLHVSFKTVNAKGKITLRIMVDSHTGGDEFETSQAQRERMKMISKETHKSLSALVSKYITKPLMMKEIKLVRPYRKKLQAQYEPDKLHVISFDFEKIMTYNADRTRLEQIWCKGGQYIKHIGAPVEQARILRANPTDYQIRAYVFDIDKSKPWEPTKNKSAFGFYEVVHKETGELLLRTYARFQTSAKTHYHYRLRFKDFLTSK